MGFEHCLLLHLYFLGVHSGAFVFADKRHFYINSPSEYVSRETNKASQMRGFIYWSLIGYLYVCFVTFEVAIYQRH